MNSDFYSHFSKEKVTGPGKGLVSLFRKKVIQQISSVRRVGDGMKVLDIGPGRGDWLKDFRDMGCKVVGIEPSPALAADLKAQGFEVHEGKADQLSSDFGTFDLVICVHLVEHLKDYDQILELFSGVSKVLSEKGVFAAVSPNFLADPKLFYDSDNSHHYPTTPHRMLQFAEDAGFRIVRTKYYCGPFAFFPIRWGLRLLFGLWPHNLFARRTWKRPFWKKLFKIKLSFYESFLMVMTKKQ